MVETTHSFGDGAASSLPKAFSTALFAVSVLVIGLYFAMAAPSPRDWSTRNPNDPYGWLTDGWISGHLYMSVAPSPKMQELADPFDPKQSAPYRIVDVSYNHGHYYLYFGAAPVVTLMVPWHLLTKHYLTEHFLVAFYLSAAFLTSLYLLTECWRRHFRGLRALW